MLEEPQMEGDWIPGKDETGIIADSTQGGFVGLMLKPRDWSHHKNPTFLYLQVEEAELLIRELDAVLERLARRS